MELAESNTAVNEPYKISSAKIKDNMPYSSKLLFEPRVQFTSESLNCSSAWERSGQRVEHCLHPINRQINILNLRPGSSTKHLSLDRIVTVQSNIAWPLQHRKTCFYTFHITPMFLFVCLFVCFCFVLFWKICIQVFFIQWQFKSWGHFNHFFFTCLCVCVCVLKNFYISSKFLSFKAVI